MCRCQLDDAYKTPIPPLGVHLARQIIKEEEDEMELYRRIKVAFNLGTSSRDIRHQLTAIARELAFNVAHSIASWQGEGVTHDVSWRPFEEEDEDEVYAEEDAEEDAEDDDDNGDNGEDGEGGEDGEDGNNGEDEENAEDGEDYNSDDSVSIFDMSEI